MLAIELTNVRKFYGHLEVLKGINLSINAGSVVAVIGRSGSGKSTMLRCINGLEEITAGKIDVVGHVLPCGNAALRALRQDVGIVFQSYNLFPHLTVEQNIGLAPRLAKKMPASSIKETVTQVLAQVGLSEKIDAYPDQLSGGQQQRVAIARSLAMRPKVMLFDEVTSALDPELTEEVLNVIAGLAEEGMTMLLVTHEMAFARSVANEIIFMHQGVVWEKGVSAEIFAEPKTAELRQFLKSSLAS